MGRPHPTKDCKTYPKCQGVNHMALFLAQFGINPEQRAEINQQLDDSRALESKPFFGTPIKTK